MNKNDKEQLVSDLHGRLEKAQATFLVHYQGLKVEEMKLLRDDLRNTGAELQVVKNRLLKLACEGTGTEAIKNYMQGPSAITLSYDDIVGPAKALVEFSKKFGKMEIQGGQISGREFNADGVKKLAGLPSKEVLLAQLLGGLQAVPASFVRLLSTMISQLLYALKAIQEQKQA
jgi:large subunit ribosomal protein L10